MLLLPFMSVGPLLSVFGLLHSRTAAVGSGDVFLFLGFGFHLVFGFARTATSAKANAILKNTLEIVVLCHIVHICLLKLTLPFLARESMMEQTHTCEGHGNAILIAGHDDMVVAN